MIGGYVGKPIGGIVNIPLPTGWLKSGTELPSRARQIADSSSTFVGPVTQGALGWRSTTTEPLWTRTPQQTPTAFVASLRSVPTGWLGAPFERPNAPKLPLPAVTSTIVVPPAATPSGWIAPWVDPVRAKPPIDTPPAAPRAPMSVVASIINTAWLSQWTPAPKANPPTQDGMPTSSGIFGAVEAIMAAAEWIIRARRRLRR